MPGRSTHGAAGGRPGHAAASGGRRRRARSTRRATLAAPERDAAGRRVRRVLQLDADLTGFTGGARAWTRRWPRTWPAYGGGRLLAGASLFEDVVKGICGTNTTWRQAVTAINRLAVAGTRRRVPRPRRPAAGGRGPPAGRSARVGYRAPAILAASRAAIDGTLAEIDADSAAGDTDRTRPACAGWPGSGPPPPGS